MLSNGLRWFAPVHVAAPRQPAFEPRCRTKSAGSVNDTQILSCCAVRHAGSRKPSLRVQRVPRVGASKAGGLSASSRLRRLFSLSARRHGILLFAAHFPSASPQEHACRPHPFGTGWAYAWREDAIGVSSGAGEFTAAIHTLIHPLPSLVHEPTDVKLPNRRLQTSETVQFASTSLAPPGRFRRMALHVARPWIRYGVTPALRRR